MLGFKNRLAGSPGARFTTKKMMVAMPRTRGMAPKSRRTMNVVIARLSWHSHP